MPSLEEGLVLVYDGDRCQVVEILGSVVVLVDSHSRARRVRLVDLLTPRSEGGLAQLPRDKNDDRGGDGDTLFGVLWKNASPRARKAAHSIAADVREVETGFRSGTSLIAEPGEPRPEYDPKATRLGDRRRAKALERQVSVRTVQTWCTRYRDLGEPGLLDGRSLRHGTFLANLAPEWLETCNSVLDELAPLAKIQKKVVLGWIEDRLLQREARGDYGEQEIRRPSRSTANNVLIELDRGRGLFTGSTKGKRSIAGKPSPPYGRAVGRRPGQYLILDTTRLNVFGLDSMRGRWDKVEMTTALDLASRTIRGVRLTPRSSKSVDVSSVLFEAMQPFDLPTSWSTSASWPYSGLPDTIVVDTDAIKVPQYWTNEDERIRREQLGHARSLKRQTDDVAHDDGLLPETIVVDHGKVYVSEHVTNFCARHGISIQPARIAMGSDKGQKGRWYGTIESLLQELPGYKGRSVDGRSEHPETEVVYTIQQLEQIVREWIATVYHHTPHSELIDPHLPGVTMTPTEAHQRGMAISGRLRVPHDRNLLIEMLPIEMRYFNHYGVDVRGLRFTGPIVAKYQNRSRLVTAGRHDWPFHYNPDDMRQIYFQDPDDRRWHTLHWIKANELDMPFSLDALEHAKSIAEDRGGRKDVEQALIELLGRLGISRGSTPREKLIAARAVAQREDSRLPINQPSSLSTVRRLLDAHHAATPTDSTPIPADIDSVPPYTAPTAEPTAEFYDDVMEDL